MNSTNSLKSSQSTSTKASESKPRLAIISTHPIQYNAPWFALLAQETGLELKVFYSWSQRQHDLHDKQFRKDIKWDIPLLEGYEHTFVKNTSANPGNSGYNGIDCPTLIREIEEFKATHILVFGWNFKAHLKAMRYFKGKIPVLFRGDSTLLDERGILKDRVRRIVLKWVYRHIDHALYVGEANKQYYLKHGVDQSKLSYAPHAIDNERFSDKDFKYFQQSMQFANELKLDKLDKVILFIGKFESKKNPLLLIQAYKILKEQADLKDELKIIFVGDGPLKEALEEQSKNHKYISILPFQNQTRMPIIYRLGRVVCLPSSGPGETWGLVVNEANACGTKAVISNKSGCSLDLGLINGNSVFESGNAQDLAEKLRHALEDEALDQEKFLNTWKFQNILDAIKLKLFKDE